MTYNILVLLVHFFLIYYMDLALLGVIIWNEYIKWVHYIIFVIFLLIETVMYIYIYFYSDWHPRDRTQK
jgi:hypothetical protein